MCCFENVKISGFSMYEDANSDDGDNLYYWGDLKYLVFLGGSVTTGIDPDDGMTTRSYGCSANFGTIYYTGQTVDSDFKLDFGTSLENSYRNKVNSLGAVVPLGDFSNGDAIALNPNLNVMGLM